MEEEHGNKTGKPVLTIVAVALLALYNSAVSQMNVQQIARARNPSFQLATAVDSSAPTNFSLDNNDTCTPQQNGPMNRANYVRRTEINYANISPNSTEAICVFDGEQPSHFPHAMQQLYVFFNYWNAHPTKKPILILSHPSLRKLGRHRQRVSREFLEMLKSQISLKVTRIQNLTRWWEEREKLAEEKPFMVESGGFDARAYKELNKHMTAHYQLNDTSSDTCSHSKPRIGILNRKDGSGRSILNAEQIATVARELSRDKHIPVAYFETYEVVDQVKFFRSVDILISPHGAQLTGLAYMDAPHCAHLFEIFPKHYAIPYYFGSLAMSTGKRHSYVYMSEGTFLEEQAKDMWERKEMRNVNLCPSIPTIVGYVQELVADWKRCCESMTTKD